MKYKVGDKVKLRNDLIIGKSYGNVEFLNGMKVLLNEELTIQNIYYDRNTFICEESNYFLSFEMIEDYTWEDFLKAPIGTKITFENGDIFVKSAEDCFDNGIVNHTYREMKDIDEDEDIEYDYKKIIKIEEPTYMTVYEPKEVVMPEIEEMKRLTDELCKTCDEFIKKIKEK